jgi:hypothetical protein
MYYSQYSPCINCQAHMPNSQMMNPQMMNPQMVAPQMQNPQMVSPQMMNQQIPQSQMASPQMMGQQMLYPQMMNQDMKYMPTGDTMMKEMQNEELRMLYPKAYQLMMPHIKHHCDELESKHGAMYCPTRKQFEDIKEDIYKCIDKALDDCEEEDDKSEKHHHERFAGENEWKEEADARRPRYGRRSAVRDLIGVALIGELLGRRAFIPYAPFVPYNPYAPIYGYGYGGIF